jgi:hypothetical protein
VKPRVGAALVQEDFLAVAVNLAVELRRVHVAILAVTVSKVTVVANLAEIDMTHKYYQNSLLSHQSTVMAYLPNTISCRIPSWENIKGLWSATVIRPRA